MERKEVDRRPGRNDSNGEAVMNNAAVLGLNLKWMIIAWLNPAEESLPIQSISKGIRAFQSSN